MTNKQANVAWLSLVLTLLLPTFAWAQEEEAAPAVKKIVAVMPFSSPTEYNAMGRNAQETFVTHLVQSQKVRVVQASMVDKMMKKKNLHFTGTIEPELLKAAGQWLKADFILAGKLRFGGDAYVLSVHVMNVKTLETTMAEDLDFRDATKMRVAVRAIAKKMGGVIAGESAMGSSAGGSKSAMFLNIDPRAFYDTSEACIRATESILRRFRFTGSVDGVEEDIKTVKVKGFAGNLQEGVPLDVFSTSGIGDAEKITTVYVTKKGDSGFEARYRQSPNDGIPLSAKVSSEGHIWTVALGTIDDEAEDNEQLVTKFREALLEKMSEGGHFQQVEGTTTDMLAKLSSRNTRNAAFKALFMRGVDLVLEGKFYGASGSRRAHFKIYSTLTGKVWGEPKFETSL